MAYRRARYSSRGRARSGSYRRSYSRTGRRRAARRTRSSQQRIVIQVIGGQGGVPASPMTLGQKSRRVVRSRF